MRISSVNLAAPGGTILVKGVAEPTGIFKQPVSHRVAIHDDQIQGDYTADRTVHGGHDKAVYAYSVEDMAWWEDVLGRDIAPGMFGENLTTEGVDLTQSVLGERWTFPSGLVLEISEPRIPCLKLAKKFDDLKMVKQFGIARRPGAYLRIVAPGDVGAGDQVTIEQPSHRVRIADFNEGVLHDRERMRPVIDLPSVADRWKAWGSERLAKTA